MQAFLVATHTMEKATEEKTASVGQTFVVEETLLEDIPARADGILFTRDQAEFVMEHLILEPRTNFSQSIDR